MDFLYFYTEIKLWTIRSSRILEIKDILCEKEPMPQNNEVYGSSYVEHHLTVLCQFWHFLLSYKLCFLAKEATLLFIHWLIHSVSFATMPSVPKIKIKNKNPKFHFVKHSKTNCTMQKYWQRGFIWMVTP